MDLRESYQRRNPWMPVPSGRPRDLVGSGHAGLAALLGATFWVDAQQSPVAGGFLKNLGTGGSALDARFGSTTGTDTNDPSKLDHTGTNYLYLPGVSGNCPSAADSAALDIAGSIECVVRVALEDWTPAGTTTLLAKRDGGGNSYQFRLNSASNGQMEIAWWTATVATVRTSTTVPPFVDGTAYWLRWTLDVTTGQARFYWASDQATEPSSWTELGAPAAAGATSIDATTAALFVGGTAGTTELAAGKFFRAIVRNGIGGTTVFDADFTRGITSGGQTSFTEFSSNAATVTINRSTSGRKAVAVVRPVLLLGTDDYLEVADNDLIDFGATDDFTLLAVVRQWATPALASNMRIFDKNGAGPGYRVFIDSATGQPRLQISDGTIQPTISSTDTITAGTLKLVAARRDVTSDAIQALQGGAWVGAGGNDTTTTTLSNGTTLRIGCISGGVSSTLDGELVAAAVFRRALTAAEIASIVSYYGAA